MKRILVALVMIVCVAGLAVSSTGAFFSDTETSTGNTFTAGAIDLRIDNTSYRSDANGLPALSQNTTWTIDDLQNEVGQTIHRFFDFADLKPSDYGEDTISLHAGSNDAYVCANVTLTSDDDNTATEPESEVDNDTGPGLGELADLVNFIWWADDGDNVLESGENVLPGGPLGALAVGQTAFITLADSVSNIWNVGNAPGPIPGDATRYIGKAWCFGTLTPTPVSQDGLSSGTPITRGTGFTCSGDGINNASQTDSVTADVSFSAVQARNNTSFTCPTGDCPIGTTNILVSGSTFEVPDVTNGAQWEVFASPTGGWTVEWRDLSPTTFGSQNRPEIANLEYHEGVLGSAFDGDQYVELDSDWGGPSDSGTGEPASVRIYQDIPTVVGQTYEVHYAFAPRPNTAAAENSLEVRWGGVVQQTIPPTAGGGGPIAWTQHQFTVVATSATTRLEFVDLGISNSEGTFLDGVQVFTEECAPIVQMDQV